VVLQEGTALGLALLFPEGFWVYGTGTLSPSNQIQGSLFQADGSAYGSFNLTIADGHVNGTIVEEGTTYSAAGRGSSDHAWSVWLDVRFFGPGWLSLGWR
jgi:hypothetical protein